MSNLYFHFVMFSLLSAGCWFAVFVVTVVAAAAVVVVVVVASTVCPQLLFYIYALLVQQLIFPCTNCINYLISDNCINKI